MKTMPLTGDFYSDDFKYIEVKLIPCFNLKNPSVTCKSKPEIEHYMQNKEMEFFYSNSYFDTTESHNDPLKYFVEDRNYEYVDVRQHQQKEVYIR